jgi:Plasmid pRiA4b ORF-3-like protein
MLLTNSEQSAEEEEKHMARQTSKGTCTFCQRELSKSGMTRHLESCEQRAAIQAEAASRQKTQKTRAFHLVVEGYRLPMYWMHLEVAAGTTLAILDRFLRDTWLECCGHLSAFEIGGVRYSVDAGMYDWDTGGKSMRVRLDKVLSPGQTCSYEYDFGSTTELTVKVLSEHEVEAEKRPIQVLARNTLPIIPCDVCGEPATGLCTQCIYEDKGCLCDVCAKDHKCGEEMLLPLVNSPRAGVCGYTGQDPAYIW